MVEFWYMNKDPYTALWVSYSSISQFLNCPRAYYLSAVYKDPATNRKMTVISPALALGQTVHEVVESLSTIEVKDRFLTPLHDRFELAWNKVSGEKGGFKSEDQEEMYKDRGRKMLLRVSDNPGPVKRLAVKIRQELPYYWLSEEEEIILCGKIDWLEYLPDIDAVHIIDFKTGKKKESDSLQLPIYLLLASNTQKRRVERLSYWYLEHDDEPTKVDFPDVGDSYNEVLVIAKKIKLARKLDRLKCPKDGCMFCKPYEEILAGNAKKVGLNDFGQDVYVVNVLSDTMASDIL